MHTIEVVVESDGTIVVPADSTQQLGLLPGTRLWVEPDVDGLYLTRDQPRYDHTDLEWHTNLRQLWHDFTLWQGENPVMLSDYAISREGIYEDHP